MLSTKHIRILCLSLIALVWVVAGCTTGESAPITENLVETESVEPTDVPSTRGIDGTLEIFMWQAPDMLNLHLSGNSTDLEIGRLTLEPLATYDDDGNLLPALAREIPSLENGGVSEDGKTVTWHLRDDILWSDGEPFTAKDVEFTYSWVVNPDIVLNARYTNIESLTVIDDYTVQLTWAETNPIWAVPFVGLSGVILPEHIFADYNGENYLEAPGNLMMVGTGPFRVRSFENDNILIIGDNSVTTTRIEFEANPYFRDPDKPYFNEVIVQGGGGDAESAAQFIINGQTDYAWNLQVADELLDEIVASPNSTLITDNSAAVEMLFLNFTDPNTATDDGEVSNIAFPHPILSDLRVRQAIAHAVDRESITQLYQRSVSVAGTYIQSPFIQTTSENPYPFDLERSAELLDEAGWVDTDGDGIRDKDDVPLRLVAGTTINPVRQGTQEIIQDALTSIGVDFETEQYDAALVFSDPSENQMSYLRFQSDILEFAYGTPVPDPGNNLGYWICEEATQKSNNWLGANFGRYCNPEYDRIYSESQLEINPDARRELLQQLDNILVNDVAVIPIVYRGEIRGIASDLEGFSPNTWDADTWNIYDWRRGS